jgi:hypothetical protein
MRRICRIFGYSRRAWKRPTCLVSLSGKKKCSWNSCFWMKDDTSHEWVQGIPERFATSSEGQVEAKDIFNTIVVFSQAAVMYCLTSFFMKWHFSSSRVSLSHLAFRSNSAKHTMPWVVLLLVWSRIQIWNSLPVLSDCRVEK